MKFLQFVGIIYLFFQDANADSVSEISNTAKEYTYVKVNNNFYRLGSDITYNVSTQKFKIQIIPVEQSAGSPIRCVESISDNDTTINVKFQKLDNKELNLFTLRPQMSILIYLIKLLELMKIQNTTLILMNITLRESRIFKSNT